MLVFNTMLENATKHSTDESLWTHVRAYIANTLHQAVDLAPWPDADTASTFLTQRYAFRVGQINGRACLLASHRDPADATPGEVAKHLARLERLFPGMVVYVAPYLPADRRARFIANGVGFVVPGNQLYLPQLAVDLREHFRARPQRSRNQLSPVAQAVLFHHLLQREPATKTPSILARALYYSAMSVGRAFDELAQFDLAMVTKQGRKKSIDFAHDGHALIEAARPILRNPTRGKKYLRSTPAPPTLKVAGESALAALTDLSSPSLPVYAIRHNEWRSFSMVAEQNTVHRDAADLMIELWHYDPKILSDTDVVDPLSLYAQYWDHANERIAQAAENLLAHVPW
jgi:hypothetical protein